jgi:hypothetical protein
MSTRASRFVVAALVGIALLTPGVASAGVQVGIGFGATFGPHWHHHPWYGVSVYAPLWPGYYWYDPWYDPWYYPAPVVVSPPVVVERPPVVVQEPKPPAPPKQEQPDLVGEKLEQKESESLKKLRIGDPENRLQAVKDLEPFVRDAKVRTALERALLSDRDPQVRKAVADLFGRLQDSHTLKALKEANANDSDRAVRQAAYKAIILIEGY